MTLWVMDNYEPEMVVGQTFRKLADQTNQGNAWGNWDPEKYTVEDSAFGFIKMKNGAVINLESSWAINLADTHEACYMISGDKGGADTLNGQARLNYIKNNRQCIEIPNLDAGGAAFFEGQSDGSPSEMEAANWIRAIRTDTDPVVLPRQALCVTRILEAIYESAKTGEPVYFD
jgi:predicted dehydrogenase